MQSQTMDYPEVRIPKPSMPALRINWLARLRELTPRFEERSSHHDDSDGFVAANFAELKAARFFSAGVPSELGGGGASYEELCEIIRTLARSCGSTALALSMPYHLTAALVWRWRHLKSPVEELLERIAREETILISSGGSDCLESSGKAEAVDGGYRVTARKIFCSGSPAGDVLLTSAVFDDPQAGPTVLHFPVAMNSPHLKVVPTWRAMGMRGTGSNEILINSAFIPANAIGLRRPQGRWHPCLHVAAKTALPLIFSTYVGLAERARDIALHEAFNKRNRPEVQLLAGEMENALFNARLTLACMVQSGASDQTGPEITNAVLMGRTTVAQLAVRTVEKAMELVGARAFYRGLGLERIFRDVQAARFHPLPEKLQQLATGRLAFGLSLDSN